MRDTREYAINRSITLDIFFVNSVTQTPKVGSGPSDERHTVFSTPWRDSGGRLDARKSPFALAVWHLRPSPGRYWKGARDERNATSRTSAPGSPFWSRCPGCRDPDAHLGDHPSDWRVCQSGAEWTARQDAGERWKRRRPGRPKASRGGTDAGAGARASSCGHRAGGLEEWAGGVAGAGCILAGTCGTDLGRAGLHLYPTEKRLRDPRGPQRLGPYSGPTTNPQSCKLETLNHRNDERRHEGAGVVGD
jgi:hypothetical protein